MIAKRSLVRYTAAAMRTPLLSIAFLVALAGLGTLDAMLVEGLPATRSMPEGTANDNLPIPSTGISDGTGVAKSTGPDVRSIATELSLDAQATSDLSILRTVVPQQTAEVESLVLLADGDRAGMMAWTESAEVKNFYRALKDALHGRFSPHVTDLLDETQQYEGRPTRNLLTFLDPDISAERLVFVRVRERLYEFHVAPGHEDVIFDLIEKLTL